MFAFVHGVTFIAGLIGGSFLNVVIDRLPRGESVLRPPSHCPGCGKRLTAAELVPLLSYLWLHGRCRRCGRAIGRRSPLVELATGLLFAAVYARFGLTLAGGGYAFFLALLLAVSLIDLEQRRIPNALIAAGLGGGALILAAGLFGARTGWAALTPLRPPGEALLGLLLGGGLLLLICLLSRGGMGAGDFKLAAVIGLFVGLKGIVLVLLLGFAAGALIGLLLILFKICGRKDALPFAPFLAAAALVAVFWGEALWRCYWRLMIG